MRKRSEHKTTYGDGVLERSLCSIRLPFEKLPSRISDGPRKNRHTM